MAESWEIVIVGGGPAGLSTWLHLHAHAPALAARTVLLEAARYPREKLCGGGLTPLADRLLDGLGVPLPEDTVDVHAITFRFGARALVWRRPRAMRVVRRRSFDHQLARQAADRGLALRQEEACLTVTRMGDGVEVRSARQTYRARVVVGADGVRSVVRRAAGLPRGGLARLRTAVLPVGDGGAAHHDAVFDFGAPGDGLPGYAWQFPCREGGVAGVDVGIFDSRMRPGAARRAMPPGRGAVLRWFAPGDAVARPHLLLVGDAAGVDAAFGEGIAQALDYGDFAAHLLIDAFARGEFSFTSADAALAAHPLGQTLRTRYGLARTLYAAAEPVDPVRILRQWLPA